MLLFYLKIVRRFICNYISEFVVNVRETKRTEELTADIPNISEDATKGLMKMEWLELVPMWAGYLIGKVSKENLSYEEKLLEQFLVKTVM